MTPKRVLEELIQQHRALREMMDQCEQLADAIDGGGGDASALLKEVAKLRAAFGAHNEFEEQLLRPLLAENDAFAAVRIDRMVEDHVAEHAAMRDQLRPGGPIDELRDVIDTLRAHLEAEERYLLTAKVLREDVVTIESSS